MNKIYLLALLVAVASANLAVDLSNIAPQIFLYGLTCLRANSVDKVILTISDGQGTISTSFLTGYRYIKGVGATVDAIVVVNDTLSPGELSVNVTSALPANFKGTIWLQILSSPSLWSQDVSKRISYLEELVLAFGERGVKVGVYSDAKTWASVFGSQGAGSDTLKTVPLWYANGDGIPSFEDFSYVSFGSWTEPSQKNYATNVYICRVTPASFDFYETEENHRRFLD